MIDKHRRVLSKIQNCIDGVMDKHDFHRARSHEVLK